MVQLNLDFLYRPRHTLKRRSSAVSEIWQLKVHGRWHETDAISPLHLWVKGLNKSKSCYSFVSKCLP